MNNLDENDRKEDNANKTDLLKVLFAVVLASVIIGIGIAPVIGVLMVVILGGIILFLNYIKNKTMIQSKVVKTESVYSMPEGLKIDMYDSIPLPYAVLNSEKTLILCNDNFKHIFTNVDISKVPIDKIIVGFNIDVERQNVKILDKEYEVYIKKHNLNHEKIEDEKYSYTVCFADISESCMLKERISNQSPVVALIFIDNYEEVLESMEESSVPLLTALIDRKLNSLAAQVGGIIRKFEKDRFLFILSQEKLEDVKEKKFEILNEVREINIGEHIPVTLSIGVGIGTESLELAMKSARAAIDLALGRGGDQVLIKDGEKYLFYGGKSGEVAHNARIRARVKADALAELIEDSDKVFIMGHKQADLDSFGSAIGIYRIVKSMGKDCNIIMGNVSVGIIRLYERLVSTDGLEDMFITEEKAMEIINSKTLVIITDTHRHTMVESSNVLDNANKVVIFDHHRKSTDFIEKAVLIYHEPYASSTSELVTEVIQYIGEKIRLKPVEADALLAGITVDTKNFCVKTGAITFEAAAYLRRNGADSVRVRLLFQNDLASYKAKAAAIQEAEIFMDNIAISFCPSNVEDSLLTVAQAADDLLNITSIKASFVICHVGEKVYISARSLGDINVQVIMEKLGGGGHQTVSGAQLENMSIDECKEKIKEVIIEYLQEVS